MTRYQDVDEQLANLNIEEEGNENFTFEDKVE